MKITNDGIRRVSQDQLNAGKAGKGGKAAEAPAKDKFKSMVSEKVNEQAKAAKTGATAKIVESRPAVTRAAEDDGMKMKLAAREMVPKVKAAAPDIRQDKVNSIKERMARGEYKVTTEELAQKLIDIGLVKKLIE